MAQTAEPNTRNLTIYLLRGVANPLDALQLEKAEIVYLEGPWDGAWPLAIRRESPHPPRWASYFDGHIDPGRLGQVSSAGALLLVPMGSLWFAVAFGQGRYLLQNRFVENSFGLRVALNAILDGSLRSVDAETFDAIAEHARYQASRDAEARDFGLDVERDLVWAVTGKPAREEIGHKITGRDALCTNAPVSLIALQEYLPAIYELYLDKTYQDNYPWIERVNEVHDEGLKEELDKALLGKIRTKPLENTWLAPPEVLEWERVHSFGFGRSSRHFELHDLHWNFYFLEICPQEEVSLEQLKGGSAFCFGEDGSPIKRWDLYRCIYAEIEVSKNHYILSGGRWYLVARDLVVEVDHFLESVPWIDIGLPDFVAESNEDEYNLSVVNASGGRFFLGHGEFPHVGTPKNRIEFCDLASVDGDLIHVKRYRSSKDLSHLFAQGFVSAESFQIDDSFRRQAFDLFPQVLRGDPGRPPKRDSLRVVFAIISSSKRTLRLPFFSRLSLRHVTKRLREGYGFRVALSRIATDDLRATNRKKRGKERAKKKKR